MNRQIKFRAWDGEKMIDTGMLHDTVRGGYEMWDGDEYHPLMQFTGLKDKGGREIYEGDILLYPDTESEYVDVGVGELKVAETAVNNFYPVEFRNGEFGVEVRDGEVFSFASESSPVWTSLRNLFEDYVDPKECEIIGNIHENPDLLAAKNPAS
jgi:uncharacterized phage protein (TIGR01671 family)